MGLEEEVLVDIDMDDVIEAFVGTLLANIALMAFMMFVVRPRKRRSRMFG